MTTGEELALVNRAKYNIHDFDKLYSYYFNKIFFYCYQRLGTREMAEDVTSFVFLKAVENLKKFDTGRGVKFGSWLYQIAHNKIIDVYRSKSFKNLEFVEDQLVDGENEVENSINNQFFNKQINLVLKKLNDKYQMIISLRFFSDMDIKEIAFTMKLKPQNVSVILHRALESFRKEFKKTFPESEIFDLDKR
jgi:RNA polymerase sigma-70 factor (ECF subfamily)